MTRSLRLSLICFVLSALCLLPIFCGCASSRSGRVLNVGVIGSGVADLITTRQAIAQGGIEANPIVGRGVLRQSLIKFAGIGAVIGFADALDRQEQRVWGHLVRVAAIGIWTSASVWNAGRH